MGGRTCKKRIGSKEEEDPLLLVPTNPTVGSPPTTVLPHIARYYRGAVLPQWERYYRPTVLPGLTAVPTIAPNRRFCGSRSGSSHGTTAGRYYRSSERYYRLGKNSLAKTSINFP